MAIEFYIVGGYVRDRVLGREAKDHDFVVTGATAEDMINLGFTPIEAQAFPVFHHPITRDEYALARTEKKVGKGYHGFEAYSDPSVTIEEDLFRRDLTCNAMARLVLDWNDQGHAKLADKIIDPFGGIQDLQNRTLRHVSEAFAEDPVRVLRTARFAARYDFTVAEETVGLMKSLVRSGELNHLTKERVWKELESAMACDYPVRFFKVLRDCEALEILFPCLTENQHVVWSALKSAAGVAANNHIRFMLLFSSGPNSMLERVGDELGMPKVLSRGTIKFNKMLSILQKVGPSVMCPEELYATLIELDVYRSPADFFTARDALIHVTQDGDILSNSERLFAAYVVSRNVSFASLSASQKSELVGSEIGQAINQKRLDEIRQAFK